MHRKKNINPRRAITVSLLLTALILATPDNLLAQTPEVNELNHPVAESTTTPPASSEPRLIPYPSSPRLKVETLGEEKLSLLQQLLELKILPKALTLRDTKLCPPIIDKVEPIDDSAQKGLATLEAHINPELHFIRQGEGSGLELKQFSIGLEFKQTRINLKHRSPRFPSEAGGFSVQMVASAPRAIRLEGRLGADIFALVPPLADCNIQSVVLCPRRFTKEGVLVPAPYKVDGILPVTTAKADGVYAPPSGVEGQLVVSLLGTPGLLLPREWRREVRGVGSISQVVKVVEGGARSSSVSDTGIDGVAGWLKVSQYPFNVAVSARADFGRAAGAVRILSKTNVTELSTVKIPNLENIMLGTSELAVIGGDCVMVAQWGVEGVG